MELNDLWSKYKESGDIRLRNELVVHYRPLLRQVAGRFSAGLPLGVDREDMYSYGVFGLMDAIEKFELDRGVKFETYASMRIKGSIIDHIRSLDWVPRSVRSKARDLERVKAELENRLGREPSDEEMAAGLGISIKELWAARSQTMVPSIVPIEPDPSLDGPWETAKHSPQNTVVDPAANPEDIVGSGEITSLVARAVANMSERSKMIVTLYYVEEMTLAEIGKLMGVTESRVCQLQSKVLHSLQSALSMGEGLAA